jgi:hypothetical protein
MAFYAKRNGPYWDADVTRQIGFESEWEICADSVKKLPKDADNKANDMHEAVVAELIERFGQSNAVLGGAPDDNNEVPGSGTPPHRVRPKTKQRYTT